MASPGLQQPAVQLLGRERECAVIDHLLADADGGVGRGFEPHPPHLD